MSNGNDLVITDEEEEKKKLKLGLVLYSHRSCMPETVGSIIGFVQVYPGTWCMVYSSYLAKKARNASCIHAMEKEID